jgi:C4-dicarboxylate-specific signal transduction histidine kinase
MFKDISHRKRAEKLVLQHQHQLELAHKAQLSALEEMASALAHELNQPLASIANYTRGCIRRIHAKSVNMYEFVSTLDEVAGLAERAGKIIHRIKDFARKDKSYYERIHINELILGMCNLINYEIKDPNINIQYQLSDDSLYIMADKIQFEQVILNLLRNGIEAMCQIGANKNKQLIIQTGLMHEKNTQLVELSIIDTGPGFLTGVIDKLFDVYFTTKHQGMGMGLSICRTIIEAHGGNISAKDNPSGGAWLQVTLPLANEK